MSTELNLKETQSEWHGTLKGYLIGFSIALLLTLASFSLVITKALSGYALIYTIVVFALIQAIIQLLFFLHLGQEAKPRWESYTFYFMLVALLTIVIGSLWVMHDLNERTMLEMNEEMHHD